MKIDFSTIEETVLPHFKGGEKEISARMFFDGSVRIMKAVLAPGASIGMHTHEDSSEVMLFRQGTATVLCDGVEEAFPTGSCHYCPKGHTHSVCNSGTVDLVIFAVVPQQ